MQVICPSCGAAVPEGARFCPSCGHGLAARGDERRVATVVFADIVGFTSLAEERDPEQTKELVDRCFERLAADVRSFGGRVDKIVGDALVALFGAPTAHEDDPERAVRAALRMQATVGAYAGDVDAPVQVRIGVNTGEVLVGALRAGGEYTAMGDVVNTAQRLQAGADPGSVLVGPATYAATREVIAYRHVGAVEVKGRDERVDTWQALEPLLPPGRRPRRPDVPVVGRDLELDLLERAVAVAVERHRAQLVVLVGEAGLGKSRLADEVAQLARVRHGAQVAEGRCVPYGEANVWWPVAEALRQALDIAPEAVLVEAEAAATVAVAAVLAPDGAGAPDAEVRRVVDGLLYLLGYEVPLRDIDPGRARSEAQAAVLTYVEAAARRAPLVLVLSDLHWADAAVLELVDALLDRLSRCPFVLLATSRAAVGDRWSAPSGRHNVALVHLDPLDRRAARRLLDALGARELEAPLREAVIDRAGGNPLFLEELVALVGDGRAGAEVLVGDGALGGLPDTLRGLVSARLDSLGDVERGVVEDAAVWGRAGKLVSLATMTGITQGLEDLDPVLDALVAADVLVVDGATWSFRSDLVREVAYSTLTKADRARKHAGIAWYLEQAQPDLTEAADRVVDVIAHHWAAAAGLAGELGDVDGVPRDVRDRALRWLEEAARRAETTQLPKVAVQLCDAALDLAGDADPERRVRLLLHRAAAHADLRDLDDARGDVAAATELAGATGVSAGTAARVLLVHGDVLQKAGDLAGADEALRAAVEGLRAAGEGPGEAEALRLLGLNRILAGESAAAEDVVGTSLALARQLGDRRGEAWALQHLAWIAFTDGRTTEAEDRLAHSAATFAELGDRGGLAWANGLQAFVRYHRGDLAGAAELGEEILEAARQRGDRWGQGMMLLLLGSSHLWSGRGFDAVRADEEALALFRAMGDRFGEVQGTVALGRALVTTGAVEEGLDLLRGAVAGVEGGPAAPEAAGLRTGLAEALAQIGSAGEVLEVLAPLGGADLGTVGLGDVERVVAEALARVQLGDHGTAEALLGEVLDGSGADGSLPSAYALSTLVLARAAAGAPTPELDELVARVDGAPNRTYLDRFVAGVARGVVAAVRGGADAVADLEALAEDLTAVDDAVAPAVLALARQVVLDRLGLPGHDVAAAEAEERWALLGVDGEGWHRALVAAADAAG